MIEGTDLAGASAGPPDAQSVEWVVNLDFDRQGTETFAEISRALVGTQKQFAIVLDGQVISAPTMNGLILNGNAQITGNSPRPRPTASRRASSTARCRSPSRRTRRSR